MTEWLAKHEIGRLIIGRLRKWELSFETVGSRWLRTVHFDLFRPSTLDMTQNPEPYQPNLKIFWTLYLGLDTWIL